MTFFTLVVVTSTLLNIVGTGMTLVSYFSNVTSFLINLTIASMIQNNECDRMNAANVERDDMPNSSKLLSVVTPTTISVCMT